MNHAGIAIGRQLVAAAIEDERFLELRQQDVAANRRRERCDEQTVIPPGVQAGERG